MENKTNSNRVLSIDAIRAITMALMLFVNDLWQNTNVPKWMEHSAADVDFLGFSDIIFPLFLFIIGMSLPHAIAARQLKGDNNLQIFKHTAGRSLLLILMGFFTVNYSEYNNDGALIHKTLWTISMIAGFILISNSYPKKWGKRNIIISKGIGYVLLGFLAIIYNGTSENGITHMQPRWWGILGLIGWSYFNASVIYLLFKNKWIATLGALIIFGITNTLSSAGILKIMFPFGGGTPESMIFSGILASLILKKYANNIKYLYSSYLIISIILFAIALIYHQFFIISKIQGTPTWVYYCMSIAFFSFIIIHYLIDIQKRTLFGGILAPAGNLTLQCYMIPYIVYALYAVIPITMPAVIFDGIWGILKSVIFSLSCIWITYGMSKAGIKLKL